MTFTIDARRLAFGAAFAALGFAFHAVAAPPPATARSQWEYRCISAEAAKVDDFAARFMTESTGWNPFIQKMAAQGWEPFQFIHSGTPSIAATCFRRPAGAEPAPKPEAPRCTPAEQAEMKKSGMSESAINSACNTK